MGKLKLSIAMTGFLLFLCCGPIVAGEKAKVEYGIVLDHEIVTLGRGDVVVPLGNMAVSRSLHSERSYVTVWTKDFDYVCIEDGNNLHIPAVNAPMIYRRDKKGNLVVSDESGKKHTLKVIHKEATSFKSKQLFPKVLAEYYVNLMNATIFDDIESADKQD